jgi:mRNA interferase RelE/StbE
MMKVKFLSAFEKELSQLRDKVLSRIILDSIELFEKADKISSIPNVKQLKGHPSAYRYRKGKYRIGFYLNEEIITFAAFDTRDKIYQKFPK